MLKKYELKTVEGKLLFKSRIGKTPELSSAGFSWKNNLGYWQANRAYIYIASLLDLFDQNDINIDLETQNFISNLHGFELKGVSVPESAKPFQIDAISYLVSSDKSGAILNLSPGLGKSYITLVAASILNCKNVLIVSPKKIVNLWVRQAKQWLNKTITNTYGTEPVDGWCVTNYDTVVNNPEAYYKNYDLIIIDESINLKNGKKKTKTEEVDGKISIKKVSATKRYEVFEKLRKFTDKIWLLSGSPADKNAADLFFQLKLIDSKVFSSYWRFVYRYCNVETNVWGTRITGTNMAKDIVGDLRDYMLVTNKKDVINLPPAIYETIYLDLNDKQQEAYNKLIDDFVIELETSPVEFVEYSDRLAIDSKLHQIASGLANVSSKDDSVKSDTVLEMIKNQQLETPCMIWVHYRKNAEALLKRIQKVNPNAEILLGGTKNADQIIENAENSQYDYFILSLESGKHGLSLQNFKTMIYYDLNYKGDTYLQSQERIERIGLKHSPTIITLIANNTVDEDIVNSLAGKSETIAKISKYDLIKLLRGLGKAND